MPESKKVEVSAKVPVRTGCNIHKAWVDDDSYKKNSHECVMWYKVEEKSKPQKLRFKVLPPPEKYEFTKQGLQWH